MQLFTPDLEHISISRFRVEISNHLAMLTTTCVLLPSRNPSHSKGLVNLKGHIYRYLCYCKPPFPACLGSHSKSGSSTISNFPASNHESLDYIGIESFNLWWIFWDFSYRSEVIEQTSRKRDLQNPSWTQVCKVLNWQICFYIIKDCWVIFWGW